MRMKAMRTVRPKIIDGFRSTEERRNPSRPRVSMPPMSATAACSSNAVGGSDGTLTSRLHDPRVEFHVEQIGDQVEEDHRERQEKEDRLEQWPVALVDRLDGLEPQARIGEDVLDGDRAADDEAERERDERDDRKERVSKAVLADDLPVGEPFRPRGEDVVLAQSLEHRRAHD